MINLTDVTFKYNKNTTVLQNACFNNVFVNSSFEIVNDVNLGDLIRNEIIQYQKNIEVVFYEIIAKNSGLKDDLSQGGHNENI